MQIVGIILLSGYLSITIYMWLEIAANNRRNGQSVIARMLRGWIATLTGCLIVLLILFLIDRPLFKDTAIKECKTYNDVAPNPPPITRKTSKTQVINI